MDMDWERSPQQSWKPVTIYIDADACPVKQEIYRVAERHALKGTALKGTADVPLASCAVKAGAEVVAPSTSGWRKEYGPVRQRRSDAPANSSVTSAIADKDNTTRRGPAVCRAAAEEDCRMSRNSRPSDRRTRRYRHWCARGRCCSATARG